mgnify:CR=1 FL=1
MPLITCIPASPSSFPSSVLEQGREVYAVPGRITDRLSDGCNKLVKDGALVFLSPKDFTSNMQRKPSRAVLFCHSLQA